MIGAGASVSSAVSDDFVESVSAGVIFGSCDVVRCVFNDVAAGRTVATSAGVKIKSMVAGDTGGIPGLASDLLGDLESEFAEC